MDSIFFERQEGQLCAQHCLNSLLQGPIFTAVDLAGYAQQLDEEEQATMAEGGFTNPEFLRFMQQPSSNMDDTGYFSVQVITKALSVWNLEIESLNSPHMKTVLENPTTQQAFICNHDSHWLTVRKLGHQWFNLNSLLRRPELISDTYLSLFLHQLQLEGYSIFVVIGTLPPCEANQVLSLVKVEQPAPHHPSSPTSHTATLTHHSTPHHKDQPRSTHRTSGTTEVVPVTSGFKHHYYSSAVKGSSVKRDTEKEKKEEQDLQVAMALSVSLEQNQEQFEIDQQLQFQQIEEEAKEKEHCVFDETAAGDEDDEEEVALTAAIYASLEDGTKRSENLREAVGPSNIKPSSSKERVSEEEIPIRLEETKETSQSNQNKDATGSTVLPTSQEELRIKRLKYLDQ